jgi:hypothetical protein
LRDKNERRSPIIKLASGDRAGDERAVRKLQLNARDHADLCTYGDHAGSGLTMTARSQKCGSGEPSAVLPPQSTHSSSASPVPSHSSHGPQQSMWRH